MCTGACRCCPPWLHSHLRMLPNQARMALSSYFSYMLSKTVNSVGGLYGVSTHCICNAQFLARDTLFHGYAKPLLAVKVPVFTRRPCILFCTQRQTAQCCMCHTTTMIADSQGLTASKLQKCMSLALSRYSTGRKQALLLTLSFCAM